MQQIKNEKNTFALQVYEWGWKLCQSQTNLNFNLFHSVRQKKTTTAFYWPPLYCLDALVHSFQLLSYKKYKKRGNKIKNKKKKNTFK